MTERKSFWICTWIFWQSIIKYKFNDAGIKTGIITDNKQDRVDAIIAYYNWYLLFDAIVISSRVGSGKEKESIFHETLRLLSEEARDWVFIDNSEKNLLIPKQMGFSTIFYDDEKRPYTSLMNYINGLWVRLNDSI